MGFESKVQVIQRGEKNRQFYLICPAPLAEALEMEKGEVIEWVVEDKWTLRIRRRPAPAKAASERSGASGKRGGRTNGPQ